MEKHPSSQEFRLKVKKSSLLKMSTKFLILTKKIKFFFDL